MRHSIAPPQPASSSFSSSSASDQEQDTNESVRSLRVWLLLLVTQRLAAILLLRPGGFLYDFSEYYTFWRYAQLFAEGLWPYRDFWLEYPPLFPLFNQAVYAFSLFFPPLPDARFWHHLFLSLSLIPFDLAVLALLYHIMKQVWDIDRAEWSAAVWVLLFVPLFSWQSFFDVLPLFSLLFIVWAMLERRPMWAGVGLAFGFLVKLLSVLAIPAALWAFANRDTAKKTYSRLFSRNNIVMLGTFTLLVLFVMVPLFIIGSEWITATMRNFGGRGAWQTIWALADGFYGYGIVPGDRFDPSPTFNSDPSQVPWWLVHAIFAAFGLWLWTRRWRWQQANVQVAFVSVTLFLFYLWSKGWSPQFTLMLLPWILFLAPNKWGIGSVLFLSLLMVWETIYYGYIIYQMDATWMLITIILLRTAMLIGLTALAVARLRMWSDESKSGKSGKSA